MFFSLNTFFFGIYFLRADKSVFLEYNILSFNSLRIVFSLLFDWMSLLFISFVLFISAMVINYREEYMSGDKFINRFIILVVMFVFSIMFLIISPNLISILLGWDGLGLVSYALVIYYQNVKSFSAGILTVLTNRIGDVALLIRIAWIANFGNWNYIFYLDFLNGEEFIDIIRYFIVLAAITKSAQLPFSSWLPAAIAAPTPVSSLVHSSTLVTAGVYLLIRFNNFLSCSVIYFLLFLSLITMFIAGLGANFEYDLKKIIALSTLSQLGLIISILALGDYELAFFHLLTHALFKALLFICAGIIIHNLGNCQDIRFMGGLVFSIPLTCTFIIICNFSLCGLPFLSGFYSKDLILEVLSIDILNIYVYLIFYLSVGLTVAYSFRLSFFVLTGSFNYNCIHYINERGIIILKSIGGLIFFVIFIGRVLAWLMFEVPYFICLPPYIKILAICFIFMGIYVGYFLSDFSIGDTIKVYNIYNLSIFSALMWNIPVISTYGVSYWPLKCGKIVTDNLDFGWFEYYGGQSLFKNISVLSQFIQLLSRNHLKIYFILVVIWIIFCILIICLNSLYRAQYWRYWGNIYIFKYL